MELEKTMDSKRFRTESDGMVIDATIVHDIDNGTVRVEGGNIAEKDTGKHIGSFTANKDNVNYNINISDREKRQRLITAIDDFVEELYGVVVNDSDSDSKASNEE